MFVTKLSVPGTRLIVPVIATGIAVSLLCQRSPAADPNSSQSETTVDLSTSQLPAIKIEPVATYLFPIQKKGIGNIDFDNKLYFDNTLSVQVFPPAEGRIVKTIAELGDEVLRGDPLYTIATTNNPV